MLTKASRRAGGLGNIYLYSPGLCVSFASIEFGSKLAVIDRSVYGCAGYDGGVAARKLISG
eukprot:SAG11_NODE_1330_length_5187_cov_6.700079_3_plen_61_part_00